MAPTIHSADGVAQLPVAHLARFRLPRVRAITGYPAAVEIQKVELTSLDSDAPAV